MDPRLRPIIDAEVAPYMKEGMTVRLGRVKVTKTLDSLGVLLAAGVLFVYMNQRDSVRRSVPRVEGPSQEDNVDLTRWRHDGEQPFHWTKGNGGHFTDTSAKTVAEMLH